MEPVWLDRSVNDFPLPPPSPYPLTPRPRGTEYIRSVCDRMYAMPTPPSPHARLGPPYSLMLVDKPDAANAFSFGFGPDGGGGIVVYSGFIDGIMSKIPAHRPSLNTSHVDEQPKPWFSSLFGSIKIASSSQYGGIDQAPSDEQTAELAILLAHELAHLILSHHLETLSSATVIVPGLISIVTDFVRAMLFPITMLFGPFVNDAVAQVGKIGSGELIKVGEYCTSMTQEIEADIVSARYV
jgi:Zn-dependent protease with chaperone function